MNALVTDRRQQEAILFNVAKGMEQVAASQIRFERDTNKFLDQVNVIKQHLASVADSSAILLQGLSTLFWLSEVEEEKLTIIVSLIKEAEKLADTIIRSYAKVAKVLQPKGLAKDELRAYRESAVTLKEVTVDLFARFVTLPQDEEFQGLMQELNDL